MWITFYCVFIFVLYNLNMKKQISKEWLAEYKNKSYDKPHTRVYKLDSFIRKNEQITTDDLNNLSFRMNEQVLRHASKRLNCKFIKIDNFTWKIVWLKK